MANQNLFKSSRGAVAPATTSINQAGGQAYEFTPEHALAQLACTGNFNDTFYGKAADQLEALRQAASKCSPKFLAQCALYAREKGYMKDMPAALAVILSKSDPVLLDTIFDRVIDNGKQVRNFVQMCRSGAFGRKSLGSGPKRLVRRWLANKSDYALFRASVGNSPSLSDVIKMVHPRPSNPTRDALYAYLIGKPHEGSALPEIVKSFEAWKKGEGSGKVPNVDFRMLTGLPLKKEDWKQIALDGAWHQTRMNLNTYERHGVLGDNEVVEALATKLRDPEQIRKARAFPYQLLAAFLFTGASLDRRLKNALQDAVEIATENVPAYDGNVSVIVDVSGSMTWGSVTGQRGSASSKVRPIEVAALVGATVLRRNDKAVMLPVDTAVHSAHNINPRDSIMTNAQKLAAFGGGGTDLGAAMSQIAAGKVIPDLIIMVSDNESWVGGNRYGSTRTMEIFNRLKIRNSNLKMVCIDTTANSTSQASSLSPDILNIGGFSDQIWETVRRFTDKSGPDQWVAEIKAISI